VTADGIKNVKLMGSITVVVKIKLVFNKLNVLKGGDGSLCIEIGLMGSIRVVVAL
jgi:hypothetical protein